MIDRAADLAKLSKYRTYRVGCVICDKRGRIIATGVNQRKSHPYQAEMAKKHGEAQKIWLHAEIAALVRCRSIPHIIYVARVDKREKTKIAKPCPICFAAIKESGCKRIVYTLDNNRFGVHDLSR